jgi:hypothetical protein
MAEKWTVVQHSGFGYAEDPTFEHGLEERQVSTRREQDRVERAGGVLFDGYCEAEDFAMSAMYPGEGAGLMPRAAGTFSENKVDGLRVYVPVREITVVG